MRLLRKHPGMGRFEFDDIHPGCLSSADARYMWGYYDTPTFVPLYGPQEVYGTIGDDTWNETVSGLVASVKELCLYEIENIAAAHNVVGQQVDECEDVLQQLARHFYFQNIKSVCDYLKAQEFLIPVLFEVRKRIDEYFGSETLANLEIFADPEDDPSDPTLFALILTKLPANEATARLARIDNEWLLDQPDEVRQTMNIDVEYVNGSV